MKATIIAALCCIASVTHALPQYEQSRQPYTSGEPRPSPSIQQAALVRPPRQQGGFGFGGGGGGGGGAQIECQRQEVAPGRFKFICDGVNPEQRTIRNEHILWLTSDGSGPQVLDIEVPNYKIDELIKAGYKTTPGGSTQINVLLRKPEQNADAEVDLPRTVGGDTSVSLQYEQPINQLVHFPNDKQYRPLSGPILPPLNGGRGRRHSDIGHAQQGFPGFWNQQVQQPPAQPNYWH